MENSTEIQKAAMIAGLIFSNFAAIVASYISIKVTLAKLEVESKQHTKDIDNLASLIGTERSRSRSND